MRNFRDDWERVVRFYLRRKLAGRRRDDRKMQPIYAVLQKVEAFLPQGGTICFYYH